MLTFDQALIDKALSDSRYTARFRDFEGARKKLFEVGNKKESSGCCGCAPSAQTQVTSAQATRAIYGELKRAVAGMSTKDQADLLQMLGVKSMQVVYNDGKSVVVKVLKV